MQKKIWKPGEKQQITIDDDLQNKVWDLERQGQRLKTHDQEIMIISTLDRKSTRLNSSHLTASRMPSSA